MAYNDVVNSNPDLLPIEWSREVIKNMTETSAVMALSQTRQMSTRVVRMPVTATLANAYWVGSTSNDFTDKKQTTDATWAGVDLNVEELAVLVVVPHALEQDNAFPIAEEILPTITEAIGKRLDQAVLFGVSKPASWPAAIFPSIVAAGQTTAEGTYADLAADIAASAGLLKNRGYATNGFAVEPGFGWQLVGLRSADGIPIYTQNLSGPRPTGLYGFPMAEVANGAWDSSEAVVIHGDWTKSVVGIRQDITFTRHDDGIITDDAGAVVFNAMQQDSSIWRAVFRVAWTRANPASRLGPNPDTATGKFPFAAITPAGS